MNEIRPSSQAMDPQPAPVSLESQMRGLRQIVLAGLSACLVLSLGVNLYLFRQVSMVTKELGASRRAVEEYEQSKEPVLKNLVAALQDFSRTHGDFTPILEKYGLKPMPTPAAATPPGK